MTTDQNENLPIVAAIDFGTSNSGCALAFRSECTESSVGEIYRIGARANRKVPTTALFDRDMNLRLFGFEAQEQYARLTENKEHEDWHYFRNFKLKLHGKMQLKREYEIEDEGGKSFPAHQVFSKSIRYLKNKLVQTLQKSNPMTELVRDQENSYYDNLIKWVITIPAIWNEPAKQFMREAAVEAGIPSRNLTFALEPEAAAVFCKSLPRGSFKDTRDEDIIKAFKPGGRYMILDLGGGTVDIAVHEVAEDGTLTEVIQASGGAWGGIHVNETFFYHIGKTFGEDYVKKYSESHFSDWQQLDDEFEERKRRLAFDSNQDEGFFIKLPVRFVIESEAKVDVQSSYKIANNKLKEVFDSSTRKITDHVRKILKVVGKLNLILMVGGFANSDYVFGVMKKEFKNERIIRPLLAETAVLEGAVMFGFFPFSVSARICRYTYGIQVNEDFIEGRHSQQYKATIDGKVKCTKIFSVIVEEGTSLHIFEKKEINTLSSSHIASDRKYMDIEFPIYASTDKTPTYTTEKTCTYVGVVKVHAPTNGWPIHVKYRVVCYFGRTEFDIKVYNDVEDSEFKATFDFLNPKY